MAKIQKVTIHVNAIPGADLGACIKESIVLSLDQFCDVHLFHNDKVYVANYEVIMQSVKAKKV